MPAGPAETLAMLTRNVGATVAAFDRQCRLVYANDEYARWFGTQPERLVGKSTDDLYGAADAVRFMPFVRRVLEGERLQYERLVSNPEGFQEWRAICLTPVRAADGGVDGFITTALGVHELQVTMAALRAANQRLSSHMDNSPLAVLELDDRLCLLHCSQRAVQLMGWSGRGPLVGRPLMQLLNGQATDPRLGEALYRLQMGQESQNRAETCLRRHDGTEVHCEWFNSALTGADGRVTSIMALVQDVSAKIEIARQQQYLAQHDPLTGLLNRAAFHERLEFSLAQMRGHAGVVALLFIDLDGFKRVNDEEGHRAGDEVLCIVAQRLLHAVREQDTVARLGGDEFLVMLDVDVTPEMPRLVGHRIIESLRQPIVVDGRALQVGASIGAAMHPPLEGDIDVLMGRADQAMYSAKRAGRGRLHYAGSV
jgi:diguanylate cyclase (GGDEF)-like protein/PAS domain S-box-containing protein